MIPDEMAFRMIGAVWIAVTGMIVAVFIGLCAWDQVAMHLTARKAMKVVWVLALSWMAASVFLATVLCSILVMIP